MIEQDIPPHISENEEAYSLLSEIHNSSESTQRDLSAKLNMSLGKVNYLLKELIKRGLISVKSFTTNPNKIKKIRYVLTKRGFNFRVQLTQHFFEKKEREYLEMKERWEELKRLQLKGAAEHGAQG